MPPFIQPTLMQVTISCGGIMASLREIKITETLLTAYNTFTHWDMIWGMHFTSQYSVFHKWIFCISQVNLPYFSYNGWMDCKDAFSCCSMLILLCNGQNVAVYKVYWLMGFSIINQWGVHLPFLCFEVVCTISYSTVVLYSRDDHGLWAWSMKKST